MIRAIVGLATGAVITLLVLAQGCKDVGVGDPCTPEQEYDPQFNGFDEKEVNVESKSFQCQTRLCLVNHFRGRVSCPYGQNKDGSDSFSSGGGPCHVPGTQTKITGNPADTQTGSTVNAQCKDRISDNSVYCSCRCANVNGATDDGANYFSCPDGYSCTQLVSSIGIGNEGLTGAYCIKNNTKYDPNAGACASSCDPSAAKCGDSNKNP